MKILRYNQINESKREDLIMDVLEELFIDYIDSNKFYNRQIRFSTYVKKENDSITAIKDPIDGCFKAYIYTASMNDIVDIDEFEKEITRQINTNIIQILNYNVISNSELKMKGVKNKITNIKIWFVDISNNIKLDEETKSIFNSLQRMGFSKSRHVMFTYHKKQRVPMSNNLKTWSRLNKREQLEEYRISIKEVSENTLKILNGGELDSKGYAHAVFNKKVSNGIINYYIEVQGRGSEIEVSQAISFGYTD